MISIMESFLVYELLTSESHKAQYWGRYYCCYVNALPPHIADGRCSMYVVHTIIYCNGDDIQHVTDNLQQCLDSAGVGDWQIN